MTTNSIGPVNRMEIWGENGEMLPRAHSTLLKQNQSYIRQLEQKMSDERKINDQKVQEQYQKVFDLSLQSRKLQNKNIEQQNELKRLNQLFQQKDEESRQLEKKLRLAQEKSRTDRQRISANRQEINILQNQVQDLTKALGDTLKVLSMCREEKSQLENSVGKLEKTLREVVDINKANRLKQQQEIGVGVVFGWFVDSVKESASLISPRLSQIYRQ